MSICDDTKSCGCTDFRIHRTRDTAVMNSITVRLRSTFERLLRGDRAGCATKVATTSVAGAAND